VLMIIQPALLRSVEREIDKLADRAESTAR